MKAKRLLTLATFLKVAVPTERFHLARWGNDAECSTAGCAIGWACQIPSFKKAGLSLRSWLPKGQLILTPAYGVYQSWDAVTAFFDISNRAALFLFDEYSYDITRPPTPEDVAKRIQQFVRDGGMRDGQPTTMP